MLKILFVLLVGLTFESIGVVLLKKGMDSMGKMNAVNAAEIIRVVKLGVTNPQILLGVFFEALFFACLLLMMSRRDISFLWPLTSLSFVFTTVAALWFLEEKVSAVRWVGVGLIVVGAGFISYSEHTKETEAPGKPGAVPAARP